MGVCLIGNQYLGGVMESSYFSVEVEKGYLIEVYLSFLSILVAKMFPPTKRGESCALLVGGW